MFLREQSCYQYALKCEVTQSSSLLHCSHNIVHFAYVWLHESHFLGVFQSTLRRSWFETLCTSLLASYCASCCCPPGERQPNDLSNRFRKYGFFVPPPTPAAFSVKYSVGSMSSYVGMVVVPLGFITVTSFAVSCCSVLIIRPFAVNE